MKNADKIINALEQLYPQAHITVVKDLPMYEERVFLDGNLIARFSSFFWDKDFDPQEIEIKVKAPLKYFTDYLDYTYDKEDLSETEYFIRNAIGKGVRKWVDESHPNN